MDDLELERDGRLKIRLETSGPPTTDESSPASASGAPQQSCSSEVRMSKGFNRASSFRSARRLMRVALSVRPCTLYRLCLRRGLCDNRSRSKTIGPCAPLRPASRT